MRELEVFFDYACPFCLRGHKYLSELIGQFPDIEVVWRPCEAHPRPEKHGLHSDLCIQGMYFALDHGLDIWLYHDIMYDAALNGRINIESADALSECVLGYLDAKQFCEALGRAEYAARVTKGNAYAYERSGVWAVPSYRMNGRGLDSVEGVGVTKGQLAKFLKG